MKYLVCGKRLTSWSWYVLHTRMTLMKPQTTNTPIMLRFKCRVHIRVLIWWWCFNYHRIVNVVRTAIGNLITRMSFGESVHFWILLVTTPPNLQEDEYHVSWTAVALKGKAACHNNTAAISLCLVLTDREFQLLRNSFDIHGFDRWTKLRPSSRPLATRTNCWEQEWF